MGFQADDAEMMLKKIPEAHPHTHIIDHLS